MMDLSLYIFGAIYISRGKLILVVGSMSATGVLTVLTRIDHPKYREISTIN